MKLSRHIYHLPLLRVVRSYKWQAANQFLKFPVEDFVTGAIKTDQ